MRTLGTQTWFGGRLMVSRAGGVFDEEGAWKQPRRGTLKQFLAAIVNFLRRAGRIGLKCAATLRRPS